MRHIFIVLLVCLGFGVSALADGRVFPPDNCSTASPFMAFNATPDSNTYCINGQSVLSNALPVCVDGQQVVKEGGQFVCKNPPEENEEAQNLTIPDCAPGEVLTGSGGVLACAGQQPAVPSGSWCGVRGVSCAGAISAPYIYKSPNKPCNGVTLTSSCVPDSEPMAYKVTAPTNCPSGYTGVILLSAYSNIKDVTCIKD